jgi:hypothetical protein
MKIERGVSFAVVHVFDVAQTDPIPNFTNPWQPPIRHPASGDEIVALALWEAMLTHAAELALTVSTREDDPLVGRDTFGSYHHAARRIWVRPGRGRADMAATLAHELAHAVTHEACTNMSRNVREVVAESVAYAVCSRFDLDLSLRSTEYVADADQAPANRVGRASAVVVAGLDDQEIQVAVRSRLAAGGGAEEDNPLRRGEPDDAADDLGQCARSRSGVLRWDVYR